VIVRVLTARVPSQNVGQFNHLLREKLNVLHQQPGLVYAKLARRLALDMGVEVAPLPLEAQRVVLKGHPAMDSTAPSSAESERNL
jgi:hypothetical protein